MAKVLNLIDEKTGWNITRGSHVEILDGEYVVVDFYTRGGNSTGRVVLNNLEGQRMYPDFFPTVIGAKIVEVEDNG